jgi:flavin reductase (DIM6/NTAB) family NADH-FMN oxidoreductase RutF
MSPSGPPLEAREPLEIDPGLWSPDDLYHLHSSLIVPRPIAWVSTVSSAGLHNLAPHSYFNAICDDPPLVMFCVEGEKHTYINCLAGGEFVVNLVPLHLAKEMELTAVNMPETESEFRWAGLEPVPSRVVAPVRVKGAKACLECSLERTFDVGKRNHVIFGRVVHYFIDCSVWRKGRVDPELLGPLARLGGRYCEIGDIFKQSRPSWREVQTAANGDTLDLVVQSRSFREEAS